MDDASKENFMCFFDLLADIDRLSEETISDDEQEDDEIYLVKNGIKIIL